MTANAPAATMQFLKLIRLESATKVRFGAFYAMCNSCLFDVLIQQASFGKMMLLWIEGVLGALNKRSVDCGDSSPLSFFR